MNPNGIQIIQPKVASTELPWVNRPPEPSTLKGLHIPPLRDCSWEWDLGFERRDCEMLNGFDLTSRNPSRRMASSCLSHIFSFCKTNWKMKRCDPRASYSDPLGPRTPDQRGIAW